MPLRKPTPPSGNPDGDELDTFSEYAFGGNPTVNDAAAYLPSHGVTHTGSTVFMDYVYNRRRDAAARGLSYGINTSTNLVGNWEYLGTGNETGSAIIDSDFESVTNTIPFLGDAGFVQLEVSGE